jgi:hypothetical protein
MIVHRDFPGDIVSNYMEETRRFPLGILPELNFIGLRPLPRRSLLTG